MGSVSEVLKNKLSWEFADMSNVENSPNVLGPFKKFS